MFPSADSWGRGYKDIIQEGSRKGVGMYTCNPSTTEAETRGVQDQPEVKSETVSKTQMNKGKSNV